MPDMTNMVLNPAIAAADELRSSGHGATYTEIFLAGAAWGLQAAKLSQAEIAAIVAAVTSKDTI